MPNPKDLPRDIGAFIRDLRHSARISLRQLAEQAGVSNPYLSQIERGLRKPSAEVLQQLASALRVSTPVMYLRAGLLEAREGHEVLDAIAADPDLTIAQKQSLSQIYETFRRENARTAGATEPPPAAAPAPAAAAPDATVPAATVPDAAASAATRPAPPAESAGPAEPAQPVEPAGTKAPKTARRPVRKVAKKAVKKAAPPAEKE